VDFSRLVDGNPTITSRQSKTSILVKDGATAVIGGLFKRTTTDTREGIPGLSKIPYLGWLFKTEQAREDNDDLLFFITQRRIVVRLPRKMSIVRPTTKERARRHKPGFDAPEVRQAGS
jgi:type II secretory pathway component GspD/PulD (secretin)